MKLKSKSEFCLYT